MLTLLSSVNTESYTGGSAFEHIPVGAVVICALFHGDADNLGNCIVISGKLISKGTRGLSGFDDDVDLNGGINIVDLEAVGSDSFRCGDADNLGEAEVVAGIDAVLGRTEGDAKSAGSDRLRIPCPACMLGVMGSDMWRRGGVGGGCSGRSDIWRRGGVGGGCAGSGSVLLRLYTLRERVGGGGGSSC